jgi:hypothetical protein
MVTAALLKHNSGKILDFHPISLNFQHKGQQMIVLTNDELDVVGKALHLADPVLAALAIIEANKALAERGTDWVGYWASLEDQLKRDLVAYLSNPPIDVMLKRVLDSLPPNHKSRGMYEGYTEFYAKHGSLSEKQMPWLERAYYNLIRGGKPKS